MFFMYQLNYNSYDKSLMKRIPDLTTVAESVNEMMGVVMKIVTAYQDQVRNIGYLITRLHGYSL